MEYESLIILFFIFKEDQLNLVCFIFSSDQFRKLNSWAALTIY